MEPCPQCGSITAIEPHDELRWVCAACGGPRVPADMRLNRTFGERRFLVEARRARGQRMGWRAAAVTGVLTGVMMLTVAASLFAVSVLSALIVGGVGLGFLPLAAFFFARGRSVDNEAMTLLDEAWAHVAEEILRAHGGELTAAEIAQTMRTTVPDAERFLARLAAQDRASSEIGDDAEIRYALRDGTVRVATEAPRARVALREREDDEAEAPPDEARERVHQGPRQRPR